MAQMELHKLKPAAFPGALAEIPDPPRELYLAGALPSEEYEYLTVVGPRKYSSYGREACERIIQGLAGTPVAIVSGLALGMDTIAHRAALANSIPTVAIPGSGLAPSALYPRTNYNLAREIAASGGALLSEFEPECKATPYSFPQRNRIMAGISRGTLIVEAAERSGTLITARLSLEYNRDVFTVPGSIFSETAQGSNRLLKEGAIPVASGSDILEQWGMKEPNRESRVAEQRLGELSDNEQKIIKLLDEPLPRESLIRQSGLTVADANILISALEIKGFIKETLGEIRRT